MAKLRHPHTILFMGASTNQEHMTIVTEWMEGGDLSGLIHKKRRHLTMKEVLNFAKQTAFGMNYLHLSNIIHRDLKLGNLLIDKFYQVKLCDFGLSCVKTRDSETRAVGSPLWSAPEVLLGKPYNESVDVYSFALCVWEMITGLEPYLHVQTWDQLVQEVAYKEIRPEIPKSCPSDLAALLKQCWSGEPKKRPSFAQIIAHLERIDNSLTK